MDTTKYKQWAQEKALSPLTIKQYIYYLADLPEPEQLNQDIIKNTCLYRNGDQVKQNEGAKAALKSLKEYLTENDKAPSWTVPKIRGITAKRNPKELSHEEQYLIITNLKNPKHRIITLLMLASGLRISEVINLHRGSIDLETYTLKGIGKHNQEFRQAFSPRIVPELRAYLEKCRKEYPFKLHRITAYLFIRRAAKKAGLTRRISPHWFRHACCYHLIKDFGWNLEEAREFMRHKDIGTTARYSRASEADVKKKFIMQEQGETPV